MPSQWNRQPEGWVFQDGYWDRTLEDRGTLFAPAQLDKSAKPDQDLTYQPYTQVSPEMYGQLYGAFGRPNSNYDGYPGVYYDQDGRFYGYANYGTWGDITATRLSLLWGLRIPLHLDACATAMVTGLRRSLRIRRLWRIWIRRLRARLGDVWRLV